MDAERILSGIKSDDRNVMVDAMTEGLSEIYIKICKDMTLITCLAHKRLNDIHEAGQHIQKAASHYLLDYAQEHGNPLMDIEEFYRRLILFVRDETEKFLGVERK